MDQFFFLDEKIDVKEYKKVILIVFNTLMSGVDEGSEFEKNNRDFIQAWKNSSEDNQKIELIKKLIEKKINIFIYSSTNNDFLSCAAFQNQKDSFHIFRGFTPENKRGKGYYTALFKKLIEICKERKLTNSIIYGKGSEIKESERTQEQINVLKFLGKLKNEGFNIEGNKLILE